MHTRHASRGGEGGSTKANEAACVRTTVPRYAQENGLACATERQFCRDCNLSRHNTRRGRRGISRDCGRCGERDGGAEGVCEQEDVSDDDKGKEWTRICALLLSRTRLPPPLSCRWIGS